MKEQIYTIPVNDAFAVDCECPVCQLEKQLETDSLNFILSPALMEPDNRVATNQKGFCHKHFELLYNRRENVLGISLIIETHLQQQMAEFDKILKKSEKGIENDTRMSPVKNLAGSFTKPSTSTSKFIDSAMLFYSNLENSCEVCDRMIRIMDRYTDTILWMYFKDVSFRKKVQNSKGFCLIHYKLLLEAAKKHLSPKQCALFISDINILMKTNMERILDEVQWFSQKFDYRNKDASWKNSKDAVPRAIEKLISHCNFK